MKIPHLSILGITIKRPTRSVWSTIGIIMVISMIMFGTVLASNLLWNIPVRRMVDDPIAGTKFMAFTGLMSQMGLFFWAAAIAVCILTLFVTPKTRETRPARLFLLASTLLTFLLLFDDAFLLHDWVFKIVFHLGEKETYLIYLSLYILYLVIFSRMILRTDWPLLLLALIGFGLSLMQDTHMMPTLIEYYSEDGAKFLGIVSWAAYYFHTSIQIIKSPSDFLTKKQG